MEENQTAMPGLIEFSVYSNPVRFVRCVDLSPKSHWDSALTGRNLIADIAAVFALSLRLAGDRRSYGYGMQYRCEYSLPSAVHSTTHRRDPSLIRDRHLLHNAGASGRTCQTARFSVPLIPPSSMRVSDPSSRREVLCKGGSRLPEGRVISDIMRSACVTGVIPLTRPFTPASLV